MIVDVNVTVPFRIQADTPEAAEAHVRRMLRDHLAEMYDSPAVVKAGAVGATAVPLSITQEQCEALDKLIDYCWAEELDEYRDCETQNDNEREGHIFESLVILDNFIHGTEKTPLEHLEG